MSTLLIVGCGYVGREVARLWQSHNYGNVLAITRDVNRRLEFENAGIEPIVGHWLHLTPSERFNQVEKVLIAVPHREESPHGELTHVRGIERLKSCLPNAVDWLYLSTTGVYGDAHDSVDESTPVQPTRIGPKIAVMGESHLLQTAPGNRRTIVRLAGIYGPGRIPLADKVRSGEPLAVPQDGWLNLIHVDDIAFTLSKCLRTDLQHSLYVLSDGHPVPRMDFYRHLAQLCGVAEPLFAVPDPSSSRALRSGDKRVNPSRLLSELAIQLQYPSYLEGLAQSLSVN